MNRNPNITRNYRGDNTVNHALYTIPSTTQQAWAHTAPQTPQEKRENDKTRYDPAPDEIKIKITAYNPHDVNQVAALIAKCYRVSKRSNIMHSTTDKYNITANPVDYMYLTIKKQNNPQNKDSV